MLPKCSLALIATFAFAATRFQSPVASALTVGGWNAARGGDSGILAGGDFAAMRNDLSAYFFGATLAESGTLTSTFLNSIDVLAISPVYGGGTDPVNALSAAEQSALATWVSGGGRALIVGECSGVGDDPGYTFASQSMINPFGPQWADSLLLEQRTATITNHTAVPAITDGPFGVVNNYSGGYVGWFQTVSPATSLGAWDANGETSLAAMNFGSGKVVFFGDNLLLYGVDASIDPNNDTLRRNTLAYLSGVAPRNRYDYNANGEVDAADYALWRKTLGQNASILAADGNLNHEVDDADYAAWRAHFGETGVIGSGAGLLAAPVPEPTSLNLLTIALGLAATRSGGRPTIRRASLLVD